MRDKVLTVVVNILAVLSLLAVLAVLAKGVSSFEFLLAMGVASFWTMAALKRSQRKP